MGISVLDSHFRGNDRRENGNDRKRKRGQDTLKDRLQDIKKVARCK